MKICPYLGKIDDPATPILFPSTLNGCHRIARVWKPSQLTQAHTCLTEAHVKCATFREEPQAVDVKIREAYFARKKRRYLVIALVILGVILLDLLVFWVLFSNATFGRSPAISTPEATIGISGAAGQDWRPIATIATLVYTPFLTSTVKPSPLPVSLTITPSVAQSVDLDRPFGSQPRFVIHRIQPGDNLYDLTKTYATTLEVLKWVNYQLHIPLWLEELIVIPINQMAVDPQMPPFEAYQVVQDAVEVRVLAASLGADEQLLCRYNNLRPEQLLTQRHWLIVPRTRK